MQGIAAALLFYGAAVVRLTEKDDSMAQNLEAAKTPGYTVEEYNGKSPFSGNDDMPVKFLNIDVGNLGEYDKNSLKRNKP